jgi:hypothetical protein
MSKWQFMRRVSINLGRLCLFAVLAGCSVDLSKLGAPPRKDASSADVPTSADLGGAGGSGVAQTGGSMGAGGSVGSDGRAATAGSSSVGGTGGSGGARADGADLAVDSAGAGGVKGDAGDVDEVPDGARDVAEDSAPTPDDGDETDRAVDASESGGDDADGAAATPEVGAAEVRDLGSDGREARGADAGDAGCLNSDCAPFIVPSSPAAMKCNLDGSTVELSWSDFSTWDPTRDSRLCDNVGAYYVQGYIAQFQPGLQVRADVYAAEDSTWHPISGGPVVQPDTAGGFDGYFCLPQKGLERTFRFRIVQANTSQDVGVACLIHVKR